MAPLACVRRLADELCDSQVEAMLRGARFHGDPHPGNALLLDDGGLGLIDFGVTGRLDAPERSSVLQMLLTLRLGEPALRYESLVAVGAIPATREPDEIKRTLARFMAVHLGPGLPAADALTDLLRLTTRLGFRLPPQTSTMFRALATLAGTLEQLSPDYPRRHATKPRSNRLRPARPSPAATTSAATGGPYPPRTHSAIEPGPANGSPVVANSTVQGTQDSTSAARTKATGRPRARRRVAADWRFTSSSGRSTPVHLPGPWACQGPRSMCCRILRTGLGLRIHRQQAATSSTATAAVTPRTRLSAPASAISSAPRLPTA